MNTSRLHTLVSQALPLAQKSYIHYKHAALIIRHGRIVARGFNTEKEHAEVCAIRNLRRSLLCD